MTSLRHHLLQIKYLLSPVFIGIKADFILKKIINRLQIRFLARCQAIKVAVQHQLNDLFIRVLPAGF